MNIRIRLMTAMMIPIMNSFVLVWVAKSIRLPIRMTPSPTTPSRQGPDAGPQYRSIAFYDTPEQKAFIEGYIKQLDASGQYDAPIVTEVSPFIKFWRAEDHHQDFVDRNPDHGYVRSVSKPRFERFREHMPDVLKDTLP